MTRETREVWEKRVERWVDSGLSAKEFAAEIGVNANSLAHWKWRLSAEKRRFAATGPVPFVEVVAPRVTEPARPAPSTMRQAPSAAPEPLEVILRDGVRVRVPAGFDAGVLQRVVVALEGR